MAPDDDLVAAVGVGPDTWPGAVLQPALEKRGDGEPLRSGEELPVALALELVQLLPTRGLRLGAHLTDIAPAVRAAADHQLATPEARLGVVVNGPFAVAPLAGT